jgi:hypothetical protein
MNYFFFMEKLIYRFLDGYLGDNVYVTKLSVFGSLLGEVNYYYFSNDGRLFFEMVKKRDELEFPRRAFCQIIESYLGIDSEISFPYLCQWIINKNFTEKCS